MKMDEYEARLVQLERMVYPELGKISNLEESLNSVSNQIDALLMAMRKYVKISTFLYSESLKKLYKDKYIVISNYNSPIIDGKVYIGKLERISDDNPALLYDVIIDNNTVDTSYLIHGDETTLRVDAKTLMGIEFIPFDDRESAKLYAELGE